MVEPVLLCTQAKKFFCASSLSILASMLVLHGSNFGATADGVGVGVAVGVGVGVGVAVGDSFGVAVLIATPLFQTSFDPDLMQVNFLPEAVEVAPALVHLAPALGVAA